MIRFFKIFKKYPELISIPACLFLWIFSIDFLRLFDPTAAAFDAGIFQIVLFAVIQFFVFIAVAWLAMRLLYGTLRRFLQFDFKTEFNNLSSWEKSKLSFAVFFGLLAVLAYLATTLAA